MSSVFFVVRVYPGYFCERYKFFSRRFQLLSQTWLGEHKAGINYIIVKLEERLVHLIDSTFQLADALLQRRNRGLFPMPIGSLCESYLRATTIGSSLILCVEAWPASFFAVLLVTFRRPP